MLITALPVPIMAFDRASTRRVDQDGHMHLTDTPISKTMICPYYGKEIPNWEALGLDALKVYNLFRDPTELRKGAASFDGKPVLLGHVPVHARNHPSDKVMGSIAKGCAFDGTYLKAEMVLWSQKAIDGVANDQVRQLSCGYRYRPDMTPGIYKGLRYDGVMRDIIGNHVALVPKGRAGPDVVIGDSEMLGRMATMAAGGLAVTLRPLMAQDAVLDVTPLLEGFTSDNFSERREAVADAIVAASAGKLAADKVLDKDAVLIALDAVADVKDDAAVTPHAPKVIPGPKGKDGSDGKDGANGITQTAMDSAIAVATAKVRSETIAEMNAVQEARIAIRPIMGEVSGAFDSAATVYKLALDHEKVETTGVDPSAFKSMVSLLVRTKAPAKPIAMDANIGKGFNDRFPNAHTIGRS